MPPRRKTLEQRLAAAKAKPPRARAPKGTGSVWLSRSGRYLGEWTDLATKVKHRPTGTSAAIVWAKIERLKHGEQANSTRSPDPLLTDYCAEWIDQGVGARGRPVRDSYSIRLEQNLRLHVAPAFAGVRVKEVTPKMVRDFLIAQRKKGYGPGTISGMRNLLSGALGAARLEDIIINN